MQKAYNTRDSQDVSDPSTNRAQRCLTYQIGRDGVFSTWYGRKRKQQLLEAQENFKVARKNYNLAKKKEREAKKLFDAQKSSKKVTENYRKLMKESIEAQKECRDAEESVEKAKRAISSEKAWKRKKLAEPINYDLFKCPAKADILIEVFYDALQFLNRNEVEKCQLVSRFWNRTIIVDLKILPLRKIQELLFSKQKYELPYYVPRWNKSSRPKFYISIAPEEIKDINRRVSIKGINRKALTNQELKHGLKNCVFEKIEGIMEKKYFEKLEEIVKTMEGKILAEKACFNFVEEEFVCFFVEKFQHLQRIFNELITTKNILLTIGLNCHNSFNHHNGNLTYLLANPGLLDFPTTFDSVELKSADYNLFIDSGVLMSFVTNCNTTSRRKIKLSLSGTNCQATNGPRIVEEFLEHENPENMVFNVYAGGLQLTDLTKETLTERNATHQIDGTIADYKREVYELKRKDGWILRAYMPRYIGYFVEFKIEKLPKMPRKREAQSLEFLQQQLLEAQENFKVARKNYNLAKQNERAAKQLFNAQKSSKEMKKNYRKLMKESIEVQKEFSDAEEGVEKVKREISKEKAWKTRKLAEPINYDLFKCPAKADISVEVFYDVLQSLSRNDVEKCQLVSRFWNYTIIVDIKILPLHKIRELSFSMHKYEFPHIRWDQSVRPKFYISIAPEEIPIKDIDRKVLTNQELKHGLKNCVFEKIEGIMGEKYFKKLEEIVRTTERKILAEKACFNFVEEEFFVEKIQHLPYILNKLITTKNIQLTIGLNHSSFDHNNGNLTYLLANPGLLDFPTTFDSIELKSADYKLFIDSGILMSFVTNCNTTSRRKIKLILSGTNCQATNGPRIVEEFLKHKNPENMVFNVYA
uniref:F-box domain-containing protein n=1 Tax=Acrobeloides nanus TaxID=290746 RepID=A0A914EM16_9BILA